MDIEQLFSEILRCFIRKLNKNPKRLVDLKDQLTIDYQYYDDPSGGFHIQADYRKIIRHMVVFIMEVFIRKYVLNQMMSFRKWQVVVLG